MTMRIYIEERNYFCAIHLAAAAPLILHPLPKAHFTTLMAPTLYPACRQQTCCPGCARRFLACPPRRYRVSQKRDPAGRDGPHICPIMGALGVGRCSAGADDRGISGTSCGGGATDYLLRGAGGRVF